MIIIKFSIYFWDILIMKKTIIYQSIILAFASAALVAQAEESDTREDKLVWELRPVNVIGYTDNSIDETLADVETIQMEALRNPAVSDIRSIFEKTPSIEVNSSSNGQAQQLRIRGFGENYAELTIDGEATPSFFAFGPYISGERSFIETDTLKQVDIVKGLQSPKQSAGALAGSINMQTFDPSDFVDADNPLYFSIKPSYSSKNKGVGSTLTLGAASGNVSSLLMYSYRRYHELENKGNDQDKTLRDKQDTNQHNLMLKGEVNLDKGRLLFTGEHFKLDNEVTPRYPRGNPSPYEEPSKRSRLSAKAELGDVLGLDELSAKVSWQKYDQTDHALGENNYLQDRAGAAVDAVKSWHGDSVENRLYFGAAFDKHKFDYKLTDRSGDAMRYVPVTHRKTAAFYVKDKITFNGGFALTPGVRVEHQKLTSSIDEAYNRNPAVEVNQGYIPEGSTTIVSPSLNATMPVGEKVKIYTTLSKGEKSADDSNLGSFDHGFGFIIPNPDLKNEKSKNIELGFSYVEQDQLEFKLNAFYSKFDDFISYKRDGVYGTTPSGSPKMVMKPFNVDKAKIYGAEMAVELAINEQLQAHAGLAWMRGNIGEQASHGVTLTQAYPKTASLGLSYHKDDMWGASVNWKLVGKGEDPENTQKFRTPGYGLVDLTAWYKPLKNMTITGGIYNVTDKKYWLSADINGQSAYDRDGNKLNLDKYTQPGRNFGVNFKYEF
ncbi:MAG: hypothetical protein CSA51_00205 [Gammaproteobacteria bacterium]|nr:MAG: hypothetical protein CSA51_00205 [Gammaproteobacteria bacterium]